jgi:SAM-dependent methyltransferase
MNDMADKAFGALAMESQPPFLVGGPENLRQLEAVMARVGANATAEKFVERVSRCFQLVHNRRQRGRMVARFRASTAYPAFRDGLRTARTLLAGKLNVLVLGCGSGLAGQPASAYAHRVLGEEFPPQLIRGCTCREVTMRQMVRRDSGGIFADLNTPVDLVLTHSLVHFLPNPSRLFRPLAPLVRDGGLYVMGHEPNARFWQNAACLEALALRRAARKRRSGWARRLAPWRLASAILRRASGSQRTDLYGDINRVLQRTMKLRGTLTPQEIHRLADIHRRGETDHEFKIGWDGLDWDQLRQSGLESFRVVWRRTYDHLGYVDPKGLTRRWRLREAELRKQYPDDGTAFCAVWKKEPMGPIEPVKAGD